ncbi:MAG: hypothetical protein IT424_05470 [Pirellulales bacterium]|nr:hypothetical protein [Pirellulales bacterium]
MRSTSPILLAAAFLLQSGCGLNTAVLQRGGSDRTGVLLNYSCGARTCDPIDPAKPTIVFTHGWNPLPNRIHATFGSSSAAAIKARCGASYNLLSWDWNGVRVPALNDGPVRVGRQQGVLLASALRRRGIDPSRTQLIGHSLGTLVVTQAAACLADLGPMAQITLLDAPKAYHEEVFCEHQPTRHAAVVENYWSPGVSGYGGHVGLAGVNNYIVRGATPLVGVADLSMSNHVYVMLWYYETIRCPSTPCGFQRSVLLRQCGAGGPCYGPVAASTSAGSRRR